MWNFARQIVLLSASLLIAGCDWSTEPECDICLTSAVVVGTVTSNGQPLAGATVHAEISAGSCVFPGFSSFDGPVVTSTSGSYRIVVSVSAPPSVRCVSVRVTPASGTGLDSRADTVETLRFRPEWKGPRARDSARVDFALESVP